MKKATLVNPVRASPPEADPPLAGTSSARTAIAASLILGVIGSVLAREASPAPIQVRFEEDHPGKHQAAAPVSLALIVERNPEAGPPADGEAQLELLLRLPGGVKLVSAEDWKPEPLPQEEKEDSSGPWRLYKRQQPVKVLPAKVPLELAVVEEGVNWVITSRAKLIQGQQGWQTFGVIFATRKAGTVQFHATPHQGGDSPRRGLAP